MSRTYRFELRVSENEKKILEQKAHKSGMSVSSFIRGTCIYSDDSNIKLIDVKPVRQFVYELTKQGTNLNQYMKFLNTYQLSKFHIREAQKVLDEEIKLLKKGNIILTNLQQELEKNNLHFKETSHPNDDY
ncbi:plasmid mobilization protein [Arcanobacterium hippocoleae]|uniref:Mobilization protein n=1 Tax=Arcanobacterium hippocoleae TaxID=149017 RepID=A0ABU1T1P7_9ACTO|nr:hypothetical protein [Arcanobacterium hippocoleae]MDR6939229.1 hypothetical protein [Arcanobacterium hippocoleae]